MTASDIAKLQQRSIDKHATPKRAKYGNVKVVVDGERFDSKAEAQHWQELKMRERAFEISGLRRQISFPLFCPVEQSSPDGDVKFATLAAEVCRYVCDFIFYDIKLKRTIVQDVKGGRATKTAVYQLKKKWLALQSGIEIEEV